MKDFARLLLIIVLLIGFGLNFSLADWTAPLPGNLSDTNTPKPINVSSTNQIKDGSLGINGIFSGWNVFAVDRLGVGPDVAETIEETIAKLDVNGRIRIRGGSPDTNRILTAVDGSGLAEWRDNLGGIQSLTAGTGITFVLNGTDNASKPDPDTLTSSGVISIFSKETQRQVTGNCSTLVALPGAISSIPQTGVLLPANCRSFVTTLQATSTSGLILTANGVPTLLPASGPITLAVNVGPSTQGSGLQIDTVDNKIKLNVDPTFGDGLRIDDNNKVSFELCADGQTWRYNAGTGKWGCVSYPLTATGESVMYLTVKNTTAWPGCPTTPAPGWGAGFQTTVNTGPGGPAFTNRITTCYRTDIACQVLILKSTDANVPSCAWGWTAHPSSGTYEEFAPGATAANPVVNFVRHCYKC